jgi:dienelactone hydrolase
MLARAKEDAESFEISDGDFRQTIPFVRIKEELDRPCDTMFRHIKAPVLALAGEYDLNIPPEHARRIEQALRSAGNTRVVSRIIPGADHSFQRSPAEAETRFRERYELASFDNPFVPELDAAILEWLADVAPTPGLAHAARHSE